MTDPASATSWAAIAAALIGAVVGAVLAFIGTVALEPVARRFLGPRLKLEGGNTDDLLVTLNPSTPRNFVVKYLRLKVKNVKLRIARDCRGYLVDVEEEQGKQFVKTDYKDVVRLLWAYESVQEGEKSGAVEHRGVDLLPEISHYLDVLSTNMINGPVILVRFASSKLKVYKQLLKIGRSYRLTIQVSADGAQPVLIRLVVCCRSCTDVDVSVEQPKRLLGHRGDLHRVLKGLIDCLPH
jgi:hypothetical protein